MSNGFISFGTRRGQQLLVVLAALEHLGGVRKKREVFAFVKRRGFLKISERDADFARTAAESRWQNELAWARKDGVMWGYLKRTRERDAWEITDKGLGRLSRYRDGLRKRGPKARPKRVVTPEFVEWFLRET